ncbi:MAG: S-layer homology domain-containing protein [Acidobacteriota bacterium]
MKIKLRIGLMVLGSFLLTALFLASAANATNHNTQIRQVMAGLNGDSTIQFVEIRMSDSSQNDWGNHTMLVFFNASGVETGRFLITSNPPGGTNFSVLFATQAFANLPGAPVPNFIIPAGLLQPDNGKVCFKSPSPEGDPGDFFPINLCLSYGSFTGDTEGGGSPAPALPITGGQSLMRLNAFAGVFGSNTNSHFALVDAAPQNTSGVSKGFSPDLSIIKTHSGNFTPGVNGVYTITVQNVGIGSTATSGTITVADTLPTGLSFVSGTGTGWSCSAIGQAVTCTNPDPLAVGASSIITLTVGVTTAGGTNVTNTATVSNPGEHNPSNNSSSNPTTIAVADLSISKTHSGNFFRGTNGNYNIFVQNIGTLASSGTTTVTDTLPAGLGFVSGTGTGWSCSAVGPDVTCTNANSIAVFGSTSFTLTVAVDNAAPSNVTNTATLSNSSDGNAANNSSSNPTTIVTPVVDLSINKTHSGNFLRGNNGNYNIAVQNIGNFASSGTTTVTDTLPAGLGFVSGIGSGWSCSAVSQDVTCTNPNAIGSFVTRSFTLTVAVDNAAPSDVTNTATVSNSGDSNSANNSSSNPTTIVNPAPDLSINKSHTGNFVRGSNRTYTISVQNVGTAATSSTTTVTDPLPVGLGFVSGTGTGWSCSAVGQDVTCTNANSIAVFGSTSITLTVAVDNAAPSSVTNTATVSTSGDANSANNSSSNPTNITPVCSVTPITFGQTIVGALSNTDCEAPHRVGRLADLFSFSGTAGQQVAIRMNGPTADPLLILVNPNGTTAASNDDCDGLNSCIPFNAASGGFFTLPSTGTFTIEATSCCGSTTFNYTLTLSINGPDLAITKSHVGNFVVGTNGLYTINVLNNGSVATTGTTTVTDTLPTGLGFVSGTGTGWTCSAVGQIVTCTHAGSIPVGTNEPIDIVVSVAADAAPSVINTASGSTAGDMNAGNNTSNDPTFVAGDNHLVQIRQIMTGANNNAAAQFVETRMSDATQSLWSNRVKLVFFDAADNQTGEFIVPGNPPGGTNRSVLFATQAFANLPGAPVPDFIIPSGLLQPGSGKVCFKNTDDLSAVAVSLCLSYGSFTGDTEGGGLPTPALSTAGARSLKRLDASTNDFGGPPTDNPGSNQNSHFAIADAIPENSGGPSAPMSFFLDVAGDNFARRHIQALSNAGITAGCGGGNYCPNNNVTRAQMSIFLIRGMGQTPVTPATGVFFDVPVGSFADGFIERMAELGITAGCGGGNYCPNNNVTRAQMSIFIIRAMGETPVNPTTGVFFDVPVGSFADGFIERMAELAITAGCGGGNYCPNNNVTRAQMGIFLQRAFSLPIPP